MIVFYHIDNGGFVLNHTILYVIICAIFTFVIGYYYKYISVSFK